MSQINRVPTGLQDLLGSKNFGDNPSDLGSIVAPTLDMFPFLAAERLSFEWNFVTSIVNGQLFAPKVPQGQLWLVDSVSVSIGDGAASAAGDSVGVSASLRNAVNSSATTPGVEHPFAQLGTHTVVTPSPTANDVLAQEFSRLVPIVSDTEIVFFASNLSNSGATGFFFTGVVRFYKLFV